MNKKAKQGNEDRYFSRAVANALKILDLLRNEQSSLSLSEIIRKTEINKTSAFRFLYTMETTGHLVRDPSGRYSLSGTGLDYSFKITPDRVRERALPHMRELRSAFAETVSLGFLFRTRIEVIEVLESPHLIRMSNRIGAIIPPHASSIGKAIIAFLEEERQERLVNSFGMLRMTEKTIVDEAQLREEYGRIKRQGWSHDDRESAIEGQCFGAPIRFKGEPIAALSISFPVYRVLEGKNRDKMLQALRSTADKISADLDR